MKIGEFLLNRKDESEVIFFEDGSYPIFDCDCDSNILGLKADGTWEKLITHGDRVEGRILKGLTNHDSLLNTTLPEVPIKKLVTYSVTNPRDSQVLGSGAIIFG